MSRANHPGRRIPRSGFVSVRSWGRFKRKRPPGWIVLLTFQAFLRAHRLGLPIGSPLVAIWRRL